MRKFFLKSFLFVFTLFLSSYLNSSYALSILPPNPPQEVPAPISLLGKQDHSYSVVFRGNGEAVVSAKFALYNIDETALSTIELRAPKVNPADVIAFQVIKEGQCIRYEPYTPQSAESSTYVPPRCLEFQEPDYFYDYSTNKYQRATIEVKGDTILVTLPTPIQTNKSGSFILYYSGFGYAKKNLFGAYNFVFETLKVNDQINNLTVGITTDSDLVLRGAKGKVDYRINPSMMAEMKTAPSMGMPAPNRQIDSFYQQIGQGTITKKASSLQPLDSYIVKGAYADSVIRLYAKELLVFAFILLIFAVLIIKLVKKLVLKSKNVQVETKKAGNALMVIGVSFISAFLTLIYTLALLFISRLNLNYGYYGGTEIVLGIFLLIISIVFYILFVMAPAIFMGIKKGFWAGVATLVLTIIWLVVFLFIIFLFIFLFQYRNEPPIIY